MVRLHPYLHFVGNAAEAMQFYHGIFGGKLDVTTYAQGHMSQVPADDNKIMHAVLEVENGVSFMASDAPANMPIQQGETVTMSLSGDDQATLQGYWDKLADGATITMPLEKAPWGDTFGMLKDKFGIEWMVNIVGQK